MASFYDLGLNSWLITSLKQLGINKPSMIQREAIPAITSDSRKHVFACSRTGSGKTLAYLLPIVQLLVEDPRPYFALILAPTRELAYQINEMITVLTQSSNAVKSLLIIGGQDEEEINDLWFGKPNIIVATPGRLLDHFKNRNYLDVCGQQSTIKFDILVLDEADQLISAGFCEQMKDILTYLDDVLTTNGIKHRRQTLVFSATLTFALEQLEKLIMQKSPDEQPVVINLLPTIDEVKVELATNPDLDQRYVLCPESVKMVYLVECLLDLAFRQLIIFCSTKKEAKLIHRVLLGLGFGGSEFNFNPVLLNSDMQQKLRFAALDKFKSLKSKVLVTTDLANRGLDLPQVDLIINYNCPKSAIIYVHRVGRTCRKPDFNSEPIVGKLEIEDEDEQPQSSGVSKKKNKKNDDPNRLRPKQSQSHLSSKYLGKSVTLITQYDIDLFKSIEGFIGVKMGKETGIDEENINTIIKQVAVAIKDAEIRIEQEESESRHLENKNRDKNKKNINKNKNKNKNRNRNKNKNKKQKVD